ncbi:Rho GTPase-activating protein domain and Small GTPase superfamily and Rho GTPase activation protein domain and P-loop containing nucleoside triphosphate hydrolase domain-containing protein [Strongyloides ratti]|uniref:Rho GTPase-activating protein domain and Small GTPase superfamily and Rho GTPase activation protein domain and P-loop containing nucleoside triphosphate hydrolase domain-containing protein n=1 Tax=Strongyloides ratti TaxID=34506 RepID=A0A090KS45_STRRB|nr:Rho GTPase-activating protein domain and Small GTPase superfamily and Rho GTPase activation protein domain and P-loop containing nucleoside triphosphate hydrolase domain-containing protein [Strongyloides ratti]CEF60185.1 Rho GTPase-activating protein domain and Small GTPase superfamily and Rho GTPase activation protein domain and P-loop containing nucleoside triphosphate hydrolase domain-containing protein [Strongyloides ratti]
MSNSETTLSTTNSSAKWHQDDSESNNGGYQHSFKLQQNIGQTNKKQHLITVAVVGLSGPSYFKGIAGVGKSCLCNRFCRQNYDDYIEEHPSILSQADFCGSPVINNDHWLWWGDIPLDPSITESFKMKTTHIRVIEQTEFLSDETYNSITHKLSHEQKDLNEYLKRASKIKLESQGKLMYISTDQLGQEDDYPKVELPDGKITIDAFIIILDPVHIKDRDLKFSSLFTIELIKMLHKTKKPIFFAATKCDIAEKKYLENIQSIFTNKEWKNFPIPCVETSAHNNVNVKELFYFIAHQLERNKNKFKLNCYEEGLSLQRRREDEVKKNFKNLLGSCIPAKNYKKIDNIPWLELFNNLSYNPHPNFTTFLNFFGTTEAINFFKEYLESLKEEWTNNCLIKHLPSLKIAFISLLNKSNIQYIMWEDAKNIILNHPLFLQYFKEFSCEENIKQTENYNKIERTKIPIEILDTVEAEKTFINYQREIEMDKREKKRELEFIQFLRECKQITPGKSFNDALIFLKGYLPFEQLNENKAIKIYDEYQYKLIEMAEKNFQELLLENVGIFYELFNNKNNKKLYMKKNFKEQWFCDDDFNEITSILVDDIRYRQLNILHDLRKRMIEKYASYISCDNYISNSCPCGFQCTDGIAMEIIDQHLQKVKEINSNISTNIEIIIHGNEILGEEFITSIQTVAIRMGYNSFNKKSPVTFTYSLNPQNFKEKLNKNTSKIFVYLMSSNEDLQKYIPKIENEIIYYEMPPVIVIPPITNNEYNKMISDDNNLSKKIHDFGKQYDLNIISCHNKYDYQLDNFIANTVNRHLSGKASNIKINLLIMCQDENPINRILEPIYPYLSNNLYSLSSGFLTFDIPIYDSSNNLNEKTSTNTSNILRVDVKIYSYHSWLNLNNNHYTNNNLNSQGYILTYQANRVASFEHMKITINNIINNNKNRNKQMEKMLSTDSYIMINALAGLEDYFQNKETNRMLTEGSQLATNCGALFLNNLQSCSNEAEKTRLINFFKNIYKISQNDILSTSTNNISDTDSNSSGFASTTINSNGSKGSTFSCNSNIPSSNNIKSPKSSRCPSQQSNFTQYSASSPLQRVKNSYSLDNQVIIPNLNNLSIHTKSNISPSTNMQLINAPLATPEDNLDLNEDLIYINELYNSVDYQKKNNDILRPAPFPTALSNISILENNLNNIDDKKKTSPNIQNEFEFNKCEIYEYNNYLKYDQCMDNKLYNMRSLSVDNEMENEDPVYEYLDYVALKKEKQSLIADRDSSIGGSDGVVSRDTTFRRRVNIISLPQYRSFDNILFNEKNDNINNEKKDKKFDWNKIPLLRFMSQNKVTKSPQTGSVKMSRDKAKSLFEVDSPKENVMEKFTSSFKKGFSKKKLKTNDKIEIFDKLNNCDKFSISVDFDRITINSKSSSHLTTSSNDCNEHEKLQCLYNHLFENKESSTTKFFRFGKKDKKNGNKKESTQQKGLLKQQVFSTKTLIELAMEDPSERIPLFVKECINFLEQEENIKTEGIYRVSGSQVGSQILEKQFRTENIFDPNVLDLPVHTVASSLKAFFNNLQEPIIPEYIHSDIIECTKLYLSGVSTQNNDDPNIEIFKKHLIHIFEKIPPINIHVLRNLAIHLQHVADHNTFNSMNFSNLAKVWWPTLFRPDMESFIQVNQKGPFLESATFWILKLGKDICIPSVD